MTIGVTAATGQLGRLVIDGLKARLPAGEVVALARDPAKGAGLGVVLREADYAKPATLGPALEGIDTLLLISSGESGPQRPAQHRNVIDAAKAAGVKRIVYTSLLHADRSPFGLAAEHRATEEAIKASGIPYTFLRNGWYVENYAGAIAGALAGGAVIGSAGEGRISAAARADYAAAAVEVLTGEGHAGKVYELAGDEAWTMADLAAELSRQTGREIPYRNLPEAEYAAALTGSGLPAAVASAIAGMDTGTSQGAVFDDSRQLSKLIARPTTPLSKAVADALR